MTCWPSWRYGPNEAAQIFDSEKDVPAGWEDHPSKVKAQADPFDHDGDGRPGGSKPKAGVKGKRRDPR